MVKMHIYSLVLLLSMPVLLLGATDFSHYAIILERQPFGAPVEEPVAPPPVVDEPPPFVQDLRLVAITESPAGTRVGFLNTQQKPPRAYFLYVGESEDGILLADADYDGERALVAKDGQQYWMRMGTAAAGVTARRPAQGDRRGPRTGVVRAPPAADEGAGEAQDSYAERRRQRLEDMRRRAEASRQLSEEEVERQLRDYQMRLIREGRTPLPIPITEDMDRQLVEEGILPPME